MHVTSAEDLTFNSGAAFMIDAQGDLTLSAGKDLAIKAQKLTFNGQTEITIEAGTTLTLKCGPSQIQLSSGGVTVSGPMISLG